MHIHNHFRFAIAVGYLVLGFMTLFPRIWKRRSERIAYGSAGFGLGAANLCWSMNWLQQAKYLPAYVIFMSIVLIIF